MSEEPARPDPNESVKAYSSARPTFERFAEYIRDLVSEYCGKHLIHTTEHRAKTLESFSKKCQRQNPDGTTKYSNPIDQITDLAGVRVIVFVRDSVEVVCQEINRLFDVIEIQDIGDRVYSQGKFGYQSKHLLIKLGTDRLTLIENVGFQHLVCEIQVRTILQHAWAEMEHDIQYKSEEGIPLDLKKRFSALAGLVEIADREFQSIQKDSENLKEAVKADLIDDLTQQGMSEKRGPSQADAIAGEQAAATRNLVRQEKYTEAIEAYTRKIHMEPTSFTLYVGRARARFLAGDIPGSLSDLDHADKLSGDPKHTSRLRMMIEHGDGPGALLAAVQNEPDANAINAGVKVAIEAVRAGDGVKAYDQYIALEGSGYNKAFALFGKAMCCALEQDLEGARSFLSSLTLRRATPMGVNISALQCILNIIERKSYDNEEKTLEAALQEFPNFNIEYSPLGAFRSGVEVKDYEQNDEIIRVLSKLTGEESFRRELT